MNHIPTEVLVFKTNLLTEEHIDSISPLLNNHPFISKWNVDGHDIDHVLRIVPSHNIESSQIVNMIRQAGFYCEELID